MLWTCETVRTISFSGEDQLAEALARRCVKDVLPEFEFQSMRPRQGGRSGVEKKFPSYLRTAKGQPVFVMLDLDDKECPPSVRQELLKCANAETLPKHFVLSIVKPESEAWLLGDPQELSRFLSVRQGGFPDAPEDLSDPKATLVTMARESKSLGHLLCPAPNAKAKVGPEYNFHLEKFVSAHWRPTKAAESCPTLARTLARLGNLME